MSRVMKGIAREGREEGGEREICSDYVTVPRVLGKRRRGDLPSHGL